MFYYMIHSVPWGSTLAQGKRNVRTIIFGSLLYIILHAYLYKAGSALNLGLYDFKEYIYYIIGLDMFAMAITYKLYYNRSILHEFKGNNDNFNYDETLHNYTPKTK
jgi:hypothetical protein